MHDETAAWLAAMMTAIAFLALLPPSGSVAARLKAMSIRPSAQSDRPGLAVLVTSLLAYVDNGGGLVEAFEEASGRRFATQEVTRERVMVMLENRCLPQERGPTLTIMAQALMACYGLSAILGCRASDGLRTVAAMQRRRAALDEAREKAFAVPRATIRLLSTLPVLTIIMGEFMGARPLSFLCRPGLGTICLILGAAFYVFGLVWIHLLMNDLGREDLWI